MPRRLPGPAAIWRSRHTAIDGWSPAVFAGGIERLSFPGAPLVVADPEVAHEVLTGRSAEFPHGDVLNRIFEPIWGRGLFVSAGPEWRWQRQAAAPAFRPALMLRLAPVFRRSAGNTLQRWRGGGQIDLQREMRSLTLNGLFEAVLSGGEDFPDAAQSGRVIERFLASTSDYGLRELLPLPRVLRRSAAARAGGEGAQVRGWVDAMIARRRADGRPRGDLLDLLLDAKNPESGKTMEDALLRDNLLGFIAAGHVTTASTLAWALWLVASHEPTRERLLAEVAEVTGGEPVGEAHVERLSFTRQVVQETLRLFPAAAAIARAAAERTSLAGFTVRRGASVLVAVYAMHRLEGWWDRPNAFDPDRFTEPSKCLAYLPFGAGPRVCIGAAFATTELIVALATLVRGARLEPCGPPPRLGVHLGAVVSTDGLWVKAVGS